MGRRPPGRSRRSASSNRDEDILLYDIGHIPGAVKLDWHTDLQNPVRRDFVDKAGFEALMAARGIANDTTVVFYGDRNNWYALLHLLAVQVLRPRRLPGHERRPRQVGGRGATRTSATCRPTRPRRTRRKEPDQAIRAFRDDVMAAAANGRAEQSALVDVRSPQEYTGEVIHMIGYPQEGAQRAGHVKGARNIPWAKAANADGTFKSADELTRALRAAEGITADKDVIAYCRIGERSSHTWFVLTYLLGYPNVRNYDGSWTEWGSLVNVPIEKNV